MGVAAIAAAARPLVLECLEQARKLPAEPLTPRDHAVAGILAFRHPDVDRLNQHLRSKNIHVMSHAGRLHIALHGYNTHNNVTTLLSELRGARLISASHTNDTVCSA